jgi:hypothetical protein
LKLYAHASKGNKYDVNPVNNEFQSLLVSVGEVDLALAQTVVLGARTRAGASVGSAHATRARLS